MSLRSGYQGNSLQPPSSTNPRGIAAPKGNRTGKKQQGTAVITLDELDRIKSQITNTHEDTYQYQRDAYRKSLQETSKGRVGQWSNTMEAQRVKREADRIKRLEDEEIERRLVDAEEQAYQDDLRKQTNERAVQAMHDKQDMVVNLKAKMLMCDVAYEQ
jgi:hypothetical protein